MVLLMIESVWLFDKVAAIRIVHSWGGKKAFAIELLRSWSAGRKHRQCISVFSQFLRPPTDASDHQRLASYHQEINAARVKRYAFAKDPDARWHAESPVTENSNRVNLWK